VKIAMELSAEEKAVLQGAWGRAAQTAMKILVALGKIYGARRLVPVRSVQVSGVSYENLGDAGLKYLEEMALDGRARVTATLNPAGMDLQNWRRLGIPSDFAEKQRRVIAAFQRMGIIPCCTCTPYLAGNLPRFGEHIAWGESSAVTYANSVIGARTNREGGPSALASALVGKTPEYGLHLEENRRPDITFEVEAPLHDQADYGALGYLVGNRARGKIPYLRGLEEPELDMLKAFAASVVTYGSKPLFHMEGITPEAAAYSPPEPVVRITREDLAEAYSALNDPLEEITFVSLGCPHLSIAQIAQIAEFLKGKKVREGVTLWLATARSTKALAEAAGYAAIIEEAGGIFACDTCMVVAPLRGRFRGVATTSAKACFYCRGKNRMAVRVGSLRQCLEAALSGRWPERRKS